MRRQRFGGPCRTARSTSWPWGPLTNLAAMLTLETALSIRITRVIAVMGRRPGHRFHPSENRATGAMLFGHGPVFRDLDAVLDPQAVSVVLASGIPVVLIPYTAARQGLMIGSDLDRVARIGIAGTWVAEHRAARGSSSGAAKRGSMAFTPSI